MIIVTKAPGYYHLRIKFVDDRRINIVGDIYIGVEVCQVCGDKKRIMGFDTASLEYSIIYICKDCLDNIWNKYKDISLDYVK